MKGLNRVVFFSKQDLMGHTMLQKAERLLESDLDLKILDLNSLLEFHHIQEYFESGLFLHSWSAEQKSKYSSIVKTAIAQLRVYFFQLAPDRFKEEIANLEYDNRENFWVLFRYFELYKKIDRDIFVQLLGIFPNHIRYILPLKQIVDHYNHEIRTFLMDYEESAELLLSHYEQKHDHEPNNYNFPKSLTDADKVDIIDAYLDSADSNLNYIELAKHAKYLKLPPKTILKAHNKADDIKELFLNDENSISVKISASLVDNQEEPVVVTHDEEEGTTYTYSRKYFNCLQTQFELFSVFSDLFFYTNDEELIELVNKDSQMDTLEKVFMQSKSEYHTGMIFARKDMISLAQLGIFIHYLKERKLSIENILQGFVITFFKEKCKVENLTFHAPSADLNAFEKIRLFAPEMEYLLKQYKNLASEGNIDHDLLQVDSNPINYSDLKSLIKQKYVTSDHQVIRMIGHLFFDKNSILAERKKGSKQRSNLFQSFRKDRLKKSDFESYQIDHLDHLISDGFLKVNDMGELIMTDPILIWVSGKIWENGSINYGHVVPVIQQEIDRMISNGFLLTSDSLFTKEEVSYINYYLNKKEFTNGKDLRNKYLHGSNNRDSAKQEMDYLYFLRTTILILLKLKDDLEQYSVLC
ncbi:hypothetical protein [Mucilaginibacter sp. SJ]|uniref:hypothetical protein n=1 Tax=Mucilaginibacter sp. SJ TaxID=3029053 RepID=UPI0023A93F77|nr:hypothetical protein [Mucilaginibacter sp. SJ]WEA01816.1 hypothetical protein MusilaSJ_02620 [Mucilaginibacter sp. SJ]